jgi:hypothetical protein
MRAILAAIAARAGRLEETAALLDEAEASREVGATGLLQAAIAAVLRGEHARAIRFLDRPLMRDMADSFVRLLADLNPLLDEPRFAPRRSRQVLVWPAEATPPDARITDLYSGVRLESGIPDVSTPPVLAES